MLYNVRMNNSTKNKIFRAIGLMSGTSADGVDAALIETDGENEIRFIGSLYLPYDSQFQQSIIRAQKEDLPLMDFLRLERAITEHHADAVKALLEQEGVSSDDVDVVGFHGCTIRHSAEEGITYQMGDPSLLTHETGIDVISDFRRRDMAAGGQGAPLAPMYHSALFSGQKKPCAVVNIGGVSNLSYMKADGSVVAGDCGPGMGLLDAFVAGFTQGQETQDTDGKYALQGAVDESLVKNAMTLPYFLKPFPKSADRHEFDMVNVLPLKVEDACATLVAVTAECIASSLQECGGAKELWLTGGGAEHPLLIQELSKRLDGVKIRKVDELNLRSDSMEAECFAWLAVRCLKRLPISYPTTTGCHKPLSGGILTSKS